MSISAKQVKELRDMTGAGMMDAKNALVETNGDMDKAIELLRERGEAKAVKKASKVAAEGIMKLKVSDDHKKGTLLEINTQTDFVAKNEGFIELSDKILNHVYENQIDTIEELNKSTIDGQNFEDFIKEQIAKIGENIVVRRVVNYTANENEYIYGYMHFNNKNGVLLKAKFDSEATEKGAEKLIQQITMHVSALGPEYISYKEFTNEFVESELAALKGQLKVLNEENEILGKPLKTIPEFGSRLQITDEVLAEKEAEIKKELLAEGKPEQILDKIIPGKMARFIEDNTQIDSQYALYEQPFVLNPEVSVEEAIAQESEKLDGTIEVLEYKRLVVGEGIEKKEEDFAAEVASQMKGQ